jgi:DNA polymerase-3 subunit delta'
VISFAAVRGHERVRDFLRAAVTQDRLPHALLFVGPEGVGKYSLALALVAWLQCEQGGDEACGACPSCRRMVAGSHSDVQVLTVATGKKEIGIDRVRELKRFMQLRPAGGKVKVALIDDAHLLTVAAQNALLKVLEEPPPHSFLVLVSSNPDALLATVRSRCQRVQFGPLPTDIVVDLLTADADLDEAAAQELAKLSEGSPGRAQTLKSCLAGAGSEQWRERLAGISQARYVQLAQLAHELNAPESHLVAKLEMLLSQLRDEAVQHVRAAQSMPDRSADLAGILRRADAVAATCKIIRRSNPNRQLLLEALLLRLADS